MAYQHSPPTSSSSVQHRHFGTSMPSGGVHLISYTIPFRRTGQVPAVASPEPYEDDGAQARDVHPKPTVGPPAALYSRNCDVFDRSHVAPARDLLGGKGR
jgi:hypothetical protein